MKEEFPNLKDGNGQKQGLWKRYIVVPGHGPTGNFCIGELLANYKDDKLQGEAITVTMDGDLVMTENYENGVLQGKPKISRDLKEYYPNWFYEKGSDGLYETDSDGLLDLPTTNRLIRYFHGHQQLVDISNALESSPRREYQPPRRVEDLTGEFNPATKGDASPIETGNPLPRSQQLQRTLSARIGVS